MAYLIDNPPVRDQWYAKRNRPLTGCTVLHTAEGVLDTIGPDTGAEATADFIRRRTTAGSYHDLVDSDSWVPLIPYEHGAYHDGTGSNNWALSISFACRTSDWRAMSPEKRAGFLRQGARAFAAQQAWRRANGFPLTELRLITKAQSDAGMSGFTYHGLRDPGRRTDPGVAAPNLFPFDEWIEACHAAMGGTDTEEDELMAAADHIISSIADYIEKAAVIRLIELKADVARVVPEIASYVEAGVVTRLEEVKGTVAGIKPADVDEEALAGLLASKLDGIDQAQIAEALRQVLRDGVGA